MESRGELLLCANDTGAVALSDDWMTLRLHSESAFAAAFALSDGSKTSNNLSHANKRRVAAWP